MFFTDDLHLAYRFYYCKKKNESYKVTYPITRQCYYRDKYFIWHKSRFYDDVKTCSDIAGIVYKFENQKIILFQNNFKYMRDLPFTVYFDFETTTEDSILHDPKIFVISYCQFYSFHPDLKQDKIVVYRSFQQNAEEIYSLDHFFQEHVKFFDPVTFDKMKDAATKVLFRQKSTSLSELFSIGLKFTMDILVKWFGYTFKPNSLELGEIQK